MNSTVALRTSLLLAVGVFGPLGSGAQPASGAPADFAAPVDLFAARAAGKVEVKFVAADEHQGLLQMRNNTGRPLVLRMPESMAAVPVLAQFGPNVNQSPPQRIGIGPAIPAFQGLGAGLRHRDNFLLAGGPRPQEEEPLAAIKANAPATLPGGVLTLAPSGTIRLATRGVCLDHGRSTPGPRIAYNIVPLNSVNSDPRLPKVLGALGDRRYELQVVQAVAWQIASNKSWDDLAKMKKPQRGGLMFTPRQLQLAQQLEREASGNMTPPATSVSLAASR